MEEVEVSVVSCKEFNHLFCWLDNEGGIELHTGAIQEINELINETAKRCVNGVSTLEVTLNRKGLELLKSKM